MLEKTNKGMTEVKNNLDASKSDKLILKLMTEKINKKYSNLSSSEREIISNYVFYSSSFLDELIRRCVIVNKRILRLI